MISIPNFYSLLLSFFLATLPQTDPAKTTGQAEPLAHERLAQPISLSGPCASVQVIEWRGTPSDAESVATLNEYCKIVIDNFLPFIYDQPGYAVKGDISKFETKLCLMPNNSKPRNLNDLKYRFALRSPKVVVWGFHQRNNNHIYIRNDVRRGTSYNHKFVLTFTHELFHSLSYQFGIFRQHGENANELEEEMAERFTEYLGLGS